jgi:hypothetical protein
MYVGIRCVRSLFKLAPSSLAGGFIPFDTFGCISAWGIVPITVATDPGSLKPASASICANRGEMLAMRMTAEALTIPRHPNIDNGVAAA